MDLDKRQNDVNDTAAFSNFEPCLQFLMSARIYYSAVTHRCLIYLCVHVASTQLSGKQHNFLYTVVAIANCFVDCSFRLVYLICVLNKTTKLVYIHINMYTVPHFSKDTWLILHSMSVYTHHTYFLISLNV